MSLIYFVIYLQKEVLKHGVCEVTDFHSTVKRIYINFFLGVLKPSSICSRRLILQEFL